MAMDPTVATAINPALLSTPLSKATASRMSDYIRKQTKATDEDYLKQDLLTEKVFSLEDFMSYILDRDDWSKLVSSPQVNDISHDSNFISLLKRYYDSITEADLYHRFAKLANYVSKDENGKPGLVAFCRNDPIPVAGSIAVRKPDVMGTDPNAIFNHPQRVSDDNCQKTGPKGCPFHWLESICFVEFKNEYEDAEETTMATQSTIDTPNPPSIDKKGEGGRSDPGSATNANTGKRRRGADSDKDEEDKSSSSEKKRRKTVQASPTTKKQCASYALEILSNGRPRTHVIGLYINYCDLHLQYFDRSIFISSMPLSFRNDSRGLIALFLVLQKLDDIQWGLMPGFERPVSNCIVPSSESRLRSKDFLNTTTFSLKDGSKLVFQDIVSRQHCLIGRGTMVVRALLTKVTDPSQSSVAVVKISLPTINRRNENDILGLAYNRAKGQFAKMLDHLPQILHWEDLCLRPNSPQAKLPKRLTNNEYEARALRLMAFRELYPVQELVKAEELCDVFRDVFKCYRWLYEEAKIHHRDISLSNIMYYRDNKGNVRGVLNDFDLAIVVGDPPSSKQRTGSKPFAACELLRNESSRHFYRHDLESMFYVILLLTCRFENGKEIENPPLQDWFTLKPELLHYYKHTILTASRGYDMPALRPPYVMFHKWLQPMRMMFRKGTADEPTWDEETLGGNVTFDKMAAIFAIDLFAQSTNNATKGANGKGDPDDPFL